MIELPLIIIFGFIAELVDSTLGMAYGVTSNSLLLSIGYAPAIASAIIHTSEVFTTIASGLSHLRLGNVDKKLFISLVAPGSIAAVIGAYVLVNFPFPGIKQIVSFYLILMGGVIILRAFGKNIFFKKVDRRLLAFIGGFVDAIGGGGWGPVVTSTLIANGENPKKAIGSVNLAEFFVTVSQASAFFIMLGLVDPLIVMAFMLGALLAAPLGAIACKKVSTDTLMVIVASAIIILNVRTLVG